MRTLSLPTFPCWAGGTKRCHLVWNTNLAQHSGSCQMSNVLQRDSPTLQYVGSMKRGLKKWVAGYKSWQRFEQLSTAVMGKENKYFLIFLENWINSYFCFLFCLSLTSSIQTTVVYITHSRSWLPCWSLVARCWVRFYGLKKVFAYILCVFNTFTPEWGVPAGLSSWIFHSLRGSPSFGDSDKQQTAASKFCSLHSEKRNTLKPLCMLYIF